ncbi:MAG: transglycosylase SLT domain-containing protein [Gemmatimonadaceae bacterium]|nr:transglycosylase SLT domain-containing protein [Gemmatimonadaceae bacterium]
MIPAVSFLRAGLWTIPTREQVARTARTVSLALGVVGSTACQPAIRPALSPAPSSAPASASAAARSAQPAGTVLQTTASKIAARDEVVDAAVAVFGDSSAVVASDSMDAEPSWDIDVRSYETHERVAHYVNLFSTTARDRMALRLSRGSRYQPMIRTKLRAAGMPEDLTYLALIESGYDPHAYSRAAAVGMWQFMSSTARDIGMRVDWWMDERRDPARATDGAIRFLGLLQKQFGSLYLAAAAYNGGPGRVARGLSRFADELEGSAGEDRFFALAEQDYLRAETKNYVPQLIAAALVAKMPEKYGIEIESRPLYVYDSVQVVPGTNMSVVAEASGTDIETMRDLNPAILRGVTPPDASVWVRLPVGSAERAKATLDTMPEVAVRGYSSIKVGNSTTTAAGLAKQHGVSLSQLKLYNPSLRTTKKGRLVSGQSVRIPYRTALAYAREIPDPSIERYGTAATASSGSRGVHVVRRGETIGAIARRYGLSESRLRSLNGMRGDRILAGQTLVVRTGATKVSTTKVASTKSTAKKSSAKSSSAKKATPKKSTAKKATTKKAPVKKSAAKKPTPKKTVASKSK